jgi:hypothetical protein
MRVFKVILPVKIYLERHYIVMPLDRLAFWVYNIPYGGIGDIKEFACLVISQRKRSSNHFMA